YDLASSENSVEAVEAGLAEIERLAGESADFQRFLRSPVISADDKAEAMDAVLARAELHPTVTKFVKVVARNGRLFALTTIIASFRALAAQGRGEISAEVTS